MPNTLKKIGGRAFEFCEEMTSITIPNSVTEIDEFAFYNCDKLEYITVPDSVQIIGKSVFSSSGIVESKLPAKLKIVSEALFSWCQQLKKVTIPADVTSIGESAFSWCTSLESITIPNKVTTIGQKAFNMCDSLTTIHLPASVSYVHFAFPNCAKLVNFKVATDSKHFSTIDGVLFTKDKTMLIAYPSGRQGSYIIPDSTIMLGGSAFRQCMGLTSVVVSKNTLNTLTENFFDRPYPNDEIFGGCENLKEVVFLNRETQMTPYCFSQSSPVIYGYSNSFMKSYSTSWNLTFRELQMERQYIVSGTADIEIYSGPANTWAVLKTVFLIILRILI